MFLQLALAPGVVLAQAATNATENLSPSRADTDRSMELPKMVVTATRTEEDPFLLPYSVSTVGPADFDRMMPRTTPEALGELPSVMLQKTSHGQGSPYLRGFTGFRTLMLIDGIRLNNSTFRDGPNQYWNTIDSLSLDRMEVVRGPSSVMYGSDAIGGTVNAISRGRDAYQEGFDWNGGLFYRFSSAEESQMGRPELSAQYDEKIGMHVGGSIKRFGDLRGGEEVGRQPQSGYDEWDFDAKVDYLLTPNSRLVYGHQTVRLDDAWRTHSTVYGVLWSGTTRGDDQKRLFDQARDLDYLQYHAVDLPGFAEEVHASLSRHYQGEQEDRIRGAGNREVQDVDVNTLGVSLQLASPSPVGRWVYGTEYYRDWVNSSYRGYDSAGNLTTIRYQGPVADDATYDLVGVFVENRLPLFDDHLELTLGGRFTYAAMDAAKVVDPDTDALMSMADSWENLVGNVRLSYQPGEAKHWTFYAGAAQGFRAPNLSDLTRFDIARSGEQEIPAFGLKPESFLSPEVGVKMDYERFSAEAAYFYTFMDDVIVRVPTGGTTSNGDLIVNKENSGAGYVHGVELVGSVRLHRDWTLWANFTWMRGELDSPVVAGGANLTDPVSRLMPTTVNAGLRWNEPKGRFWAELAATVAEKQDRLAPNDIRDTQRIPEGGTPGYAVCHLRAGWNPCRNVTVTAALENFTDQDYRIHGSGVNEPGRGVVVTASLRF